MTAGEGRGEGSWGSVGKMKVTGQEFRGTGREIACKVIGDEFL